MSNQEALAKPVGGVDLSALGLTSDGTLEPSVGGVDLSEPELTPEDIAFKRWKVQTLSPDAEIRWALMTGLGEDDLKVLKNYLSPDDPDVDLSGINIEDIARAMDEISEARLLGVKALGVKSIKEAIDKKRESILNSLADHELYALEQYLSPEDYEVDFSTYKNADIISAIALVREAQLAGATSFDPETIEEAIAMKKKSMLGGYKDDLYAVSHYLSPKRPDGDFSKYSIVEIQRALDYIDDAHAISLDPKNPETSKQVNDMRRRRSLFEYLKKPGAPLTLAELHDIIIGYDEGGQFKIDEDWQTLEEKGWQHLSDIYTEIAEDNIDWYQYDTNSLEYATWRALEIKKYREKYRAARKLGPKAVLGSFKAIKHHLDTSGLPPDTTLNPYS